MQRQAIVICLSGVLTGAAALNAHTGPGTRLHSAARQAPTPETASPQPQAQEQTPESKLTFEGDTALWTVAIRADKTADFERVMMRLREALLKSNDPTRQRQAEGWKVVRLSMPLPNGNIGYVHLVNPVVPGADYTVMQILYDAFPDERQMLYDLYRGAFAGNLALATGNVMIDLRRHASPPPDSVPVPAPAAPAPATESASPPAPASPTPPPSPATPGR